MTPLNHSLLYGTLSLLMTHGLLKFHNLTLPSMDLKPPTGHFPHSSTVKKLIKPFFFFFHSDITRVQ